LTQFAEDPEARLGIVSRLFRLSHTWYSRSLQNIHFASMFTFKSRF
jgi:hypothetical protein